MIFFCSSDKLSQRSSNLSLVLGLVTGAFLFSFFVSGSFFVTSVSVVALFIGGLLVGIGTRYGRGCTSGHGICGVSSGSLSSLVSTLIFVFVGICTALLIKFFGVFVW